VSLVVSVQVKAVVINVTLPGAKAYVRKRHGKKPAKTTTSNYICAKGTVEAYTTKGHSTVYCSDEIHAFIYSIGQTPGTKPPAGAVKTKVKDGAWHFDKVPNAQCEDTEPTAPNNRLALWYKPRGGDFSPPKEVDFKGICSDKTDCEQGPPPTGKKKVAKA
jgi:hypothetical protein